MNKPATRKLLTRKPVTTTTRRRSCGSACPMAQRRPAFRRVIVKPKTIADAYRLRGEYRTAATLAVFPGEVLTRSMRRSAMPRWCPAAVAYGAQALVAAAIGAGRLAACRTAPAADRALRAPRRTAPRRVRHRLDRAARAHRRRHLGPASPSAMPRPGCCRRRFAARNGVALPVVFEPSDLGAALLLLGFAALLAAPGRPRLSAVAGRGVAGADQRAIRHASGDETITVSNLFIRQTQAS